MRYLDMVFSWSHDKGDFFLCGWDVQTKVRRRHHSTCPHQLVVSS